MPNGKEPRARRTPRAAYDMIRRNARRAQARELEAVPPKPPTETPQWLNDVAASLPPLVPRVDAARALNASPRLIDRLILAGKLRAVRPEASGSSRVLIPRTELIAWLSAHQMQCST